MLVIWANDSLLKISLMLQVDLSTQIDKEAIEKAYTEVRKDTNETEW